MFQTTLHSEEGTYLLTKNSFCPFFFLQQDMSCPRANCTWLAAAAHGRLSIKEWSNVEARSGFCCYQCPGVLSGVNLCYDMVLLDTILLFPPSQKGNNRQPHTSLTASLATWIYLADVTCSYSRGCPLESRWPSVDLKKRIDAIHPFRKHQQTTKYINCQECHEHPMKAGDDCCLGKYKQPTIILIYIIIN